MSRAELIQMEEVEQFLEDNNVHEEWRRLFRENPVLLDGIRSILARISAGYSVPERQYVLRAFSYLPPKLVKVVIVGHEPIGGNALATGLAFSFPPGAKIDSGVGNPRRSTMWEEGLSVPTVHDALCGAGILEQGGTYDCCHEVWAVRGALLLNATLTLKHRLPDFHPAFIAEILLQVARRSQASRLFVACWGSEAENVGTRFISLLGSAGIPRQVIKYEKRQEKREGPQGAKYVVYIGHHPTFPRGNNFFLEQATQQFSEMNEVYPGLFALENIKENSACGPADKEPDGGKLEGTKQNFTRACLSENNVNK